MPIRNLIEILNAFSRYLNVINNINGCDEIIDQVQANTLDSCFIKLRGHMGETYWLKVWLSDSTGELCIVNDRNDDIFSFAEEWEWTEDQVSYMKTGHPLISF